MKFFDMIIDHFKYFWNNIVWDSTLALKVLEAMINLGCFEPVGVLCIWGTQHIIGRVWHCP